MPDREEPQMLEQNIARLMQRAHEPPRMDPDARARILGQLEARRSSKRRLRPVAAVLVALAACALVFLAVTRRQGSDADESASEVAALHANEAPRARTVTLADGSTAILRADAAIEELGPRRIRLVRGEAILDVTPADDPFVVETEHGRALALGTRFAVRSDIGEVVTSVLRGTVRIETDEAEEMLLAGESGTLRDGAVSRRAARRLTHEIGWARDALTEDASRSKPARRGNLVARDPRGTGEWPLPIRRMKVDVYVEDGIARTTIDQTFFNHVHRQLEGVYSFPLPPDAAVSRLAMYVDGKLMEGGIVERQRGRDVYESIVYQRRDPALLEWMAGNAFRMRVFPLPARTEKRIVLSWTEALPELYGDYDVRVPIPEIDLPVDELEIAVKVADGRRWELSSSSHALETALERGYRVARLSAKQATIGDDLALRLHRVEGAAPEAELAVDGDHVMVRVRPDLPDAPRHAKRRWVVLYDTSASRSPTDLHAQAYFLQRFLNAADENDRLGLVAFDSTQRAYASSLERVDDIDAARMAAFVEHEGREHVGATDLHAALTRALELLATEDEGEPHILLLGDGLATASGEQSGPQLQALLRDRATFVGVAIGDTTDAPLLRGLADATQGLAVQLDPGADLAWEAIELVSTLDTARLHAVEVELLDAAGAPIDVPTHASAGSLTDGEALVVLAKGPLPASVRVHGSFAGDRWSRTFALPEPDTEAAFVPRLWARARVAALQSESVQANAKEITALGLEHFLVTPTTSLLVLENEEMYRRLAVTRPKADGWAHYDAPATIPVVYEPGTIEIPTGSHVVRTPVDVIGWSDPYAGARFRSTRDDFDGLGFSGVGRGGGGIGEGTIGLGKLALVGAGSGFAGRGIRLRGGASLDDASAAEEEIPASAPTTVLVPSSHTSSEIAFQSGASGYARERRSTATLARPSVSTAQRRPWPRALSYGWDPGLDDLTEHLPAIFEDAFDLERERLLVASADGQHGSITDDARELVEAARAAAVVGELQLDDGVRLSLTRDGRFRAVRATGHLPYEIVYDGSDATVLYPELELAIRRRIGAASPVLLAQWAPWLLASPDHLAQWYEVSAIGPRTISLRVRDEAPELASETIVELDASNRVTSISTQREGGSADRLEIRYGARGLSVVANGRTREVTVVSGAPGALEPSRDPSGWPVVELPLRPAADRRAEADALETGSTAWRSAMHQLMASLVAERKPAELPHVLALLLADPAAIARGELVLASAGAQGFGAAQWSELERRSGGGDPILAYLSARRGATSDAQLRKRFAAVAKAHPGTLVGMLSAYRVALLDRNGAPTLAFLDAYDEPSFAFAATYRAAGNAWDRPDRAAALWEALARRVPQWRVFALYTAGSALYGRGRYDDAAARFEQMFDAAAALGEPAIVDWTVQQSFTMSRGGTGRWRASWARWREQVRASKRDVDAATFVLAALQLRETADARRMLRDLQPEALDPATALGVVDALVDASENAEAQRMLAPLLEKFADDPDLHLRASTLAEQQGRLRDAATHVERVLELAMADGLELTRLRQLYARLLDLESRVVQAVGDDAGPERALSVAARWRVEDPDNDEIDVRTAQLLFASDRSDEALRHLSSIVERHPALGDAHAKVAETLEREALFERADEAWARAFAVEPTNPTWLLRRAQCRMAYADPEDARDFLRQIADGEWQPRFAAVVSQAAALGQR